MMMENVYVNLHITTIVIKENIHHINTIVVHFQRITKELEIFTIFVFSFHPNFVTIGDRAFAIHCVFKQQAISVAANIDFIS